MNNIKQVFLNSIPRILSIVIDIFKHYSKYGASNLSFRCSDILYIETIIEIQNLITEFLLVLKDYICFAILIIPWQNQTV